MVAEKNKNWQKDAGVGPLKISCFFISHLAHFSKSIFKMTRELISIFELDYSTIFQALLVKSSNVDVAFFIS